MRPAPHTLLALAASLTLPACNREPEPDAYGNFEANEVVVSAQVGGPLLSFTPVEGMTLAQGAVVAQIDTVPAALEHGQIVAQRQATQSRTGEAAEQIGVLVVQRDIAERTLARTRRLRAVDAATAQQLDQAEREYRTLVAQIEAIRAQRSSIGRDVSTVDARVALIADRIARSRVVNPEAGTVLATYARAGEFVQAGTPLYRIARLDTLTLRAYVDETQLALVRLGQRVTVHVDRGEALRAASGVVTWVSPKAEFTPTPVQTRDERADLVYAIKVRVPNHDGSLKIGMPADVRFAASVAAR